MSGRATKSANRQIRKALGPDAADALSFQEARLQIALSVIRRGFWGRFKWLIFGR